MTSAIQSDTTPLLTFSPTTELASLLHGAGLSPLSDIGWIRVKGEDRVRWLNGMVTNSIQQLNPGEGCYNFVLSVQGRIQGDAYIFAEPESLLIETASTQLRTLMPLLDRFIIMDDVELTDISGTRSGIAVSGPQAASFLQGVGLQIEALGPIQMRITPWNGADVTAIRAYAPLVPHFEIWSDAATIAALSEALIAAGASLCSPESRDWLRLLEGTPLYSKDIRDRELPQETGQTRALHFAKGCYLGQEIVERIRSRGNVHRIFSGFQLKGERPAAGSILEADGKQVGELTSVSAIPSVGDKGQTLQLALGYVRREALDRGTPLVYPGGVAEPVSLPFYSQANSSQTAPEPSERA